MDFEGNLWLKLPKLGRKAMLGMMEGREIARLDTAMVQKEGRHALHEAYEKMEVFGTEFTYRSRVSLRTRNLSCAGCSAREEMLMSTKAIRIVGIQLFISQHIMAVWSA